MASPATKYRWQEGDHEIVRSICWSPPGCHGGCGVLLHVKNGVLEKVEGDVSNRYNSGWMCVRGLAVKELIYHPQRLKYPLLRQGERGENRWQRISWAEALEIIADKFSAIRDQYSAEAAIFCKGTARDIGGWLPSLCYGFGSPNYFGFGPANGNACYRPRVAVSTAMLGGMMIPDLGQFEYSDDQNQVNPKCILIWGANPIISHPDGLFGGKVLEAMKQGSELIVVDPQRTPLATRARQWLQVKPGTDAALALGFIHIILEQNLGDANYCRNWTVGLQDLRRAAVSYTPEKVSQITGLRSEDIIAAARFFAQSHPANLIWGVGIDMNPGCLGTIQALISLMAITGNIEIPGGVVIAGDPLGVKRRGDDLSDYPRIQKRRIGAEQYPLQEVGNPYAQPDVLLNQMETKQPYPIKAAWLQGVGVIPSGFADPQRVLRLFKTLDFTVIVDVFLNPAAVVFADLVLPAAMYPEKNSLYVQNSQLGAINQALEPPGDCRSDADIVLEVGKRIAPDYFLWRTVQEWMDERLQPAGITFAELREQGSLTPTLNFNRLPMSGLRQEGNPVFSTPSGKIELRSSILENCGLNPLPHYQPYVPLEDSQDKFPLILTTGARKPYFFCMEHRQAPSLRQRQPQPEVSIHPQMANDRGIGEGDWVEIFSPFGRCTMVARLTDRYAPEVIHCDANWWFPEEEAAEPHLFGLHRSNVNSLFPSGLQGPGGFGYPFRNFRCQIQRLERGAVQS